MGFVLTMVSTARTPNAAGDSAALEAGASSAPSEAQAAAESGASDTAPQLITATKVQSGVPSARYLFWVGAVCTAFALVALLAAAAEPGEQPSNLITIVSAALALIVLLGDLYRTLAARAVGLSPFTLLPFVGTGLVCAAAFTAVFSGVAGAVTPLIACAPLLAAATLSLGNAFSWLGAKVVRADTDYLYPQPTTNLQGISLGATLTYGPGKVIAVDGRVLRGCIAVDERRFSPVSNFRIREEEEIVYAGSQVIAGSAEITALTTPQDATLCQLQRALAPMLEDAERGLEREDARASRWSALVILFLAAATGIFWHERSQGYVQPLLAAGIVALFASVCQVSGLVYGLRQALVRRWMSRGYLLSSASSCKELAAIRTVECDPSLSGEGSFVRGVGLELLDDRLATSALCEFVCALLGRAEDSTLSAVGDYCRRQVRAPSVERVVDLREYTGRGICGVVHGVELSIGSEDFLVERGIMVQPSDGNVSGIARQVVFVAIDDDVVARIYVASDQESAVPAEGSTQWRGGVSVSASPGITRALGEETLLIRGKESDLVSQTALREVTRFDPEEGVIRRSTVVAFSREVEPLEALLDECRRHIQAVDRFRLLVGFGGLMVLVATFSGVTTPLIPLLLVASVGGLVYLSHRTC